VLLEGGVSAFVKTSARHGPPSSRLRRDIGRHRRTLKNQTHGTVQQNLGVRSVERFARPFWANTGIVTDVYPVPQKR
jgi:hypothetical protein